MSSEVNEMLHLVATLAAIGKQLGQCRRSTLVCHQLAIVFYTQPGMDASNPSTSKAWISRFAGVLLGLTGLPTRFLGCGC